MSDAHLTTQFNRTKRSGGHLDEGGEGGAKQGPRISQRGGAIPANVKSSSRGSSDHLNPQRSDVAGPRTPQRGGHDRVGHDRVNPTAGKAKSGSKNQQHPNNTR